jgi:DNA-binding winged helix-turn-helix (wHTH) protein
VPPRGYHFGQFVLDPDDRRLLRDGVPVELNARYLDALGLLVRNAGSLISKDRFLSEVWKDVPVTDEALTQCIRLLRQRLVDDASRPRFIETVPKHGYRFIAEVRWCEGSAPVDNAAPHTLPPSAAPSALRRMAMMAGAGTLGAGGAGLIGGLAYGFIAATPPLPNGGGAASSVFVLLWLTLAVALVGGAGVSLGIAIAEAAGKRPWLTLGGAAGGMIVGAVVKLLGIDAFNLLFGQSPAAITGGLEGLFLGAGVGLGATLSGMGGSDRSLRSVAARAALCGGAAGSVVVLLGGHLLAGSFEQLVQTFPQSRIGLAQIGGLFGEQGLGPVAEAASAFVEGALFAAGVVVAMTLARRDLDRPEGRSALSSSLVTSGRDGAPRLG